MNGNKIFFEKIIMMKGGQVAFRDNSQGEIVGICNIFLLGKSLISNILFVNGLKKNLIIIRQL